MTPRYVRTNDEARDRDHDKVTRRRQATGGWNGLPVCDAEQQGQKACSIEHVVAWSTGQVETSA